MAFRTAAAFRILADVAVYRLRKREGGNLVTSMTLAVALALPIGDLAYRFVFGVLLNLFVYLMNDCFDVRLDLAAEGRDVDRTRFLHGHRREGWATVVVLGLILAALGGVHSMGLLVAIVFNAVLIAAYSGLLKRLPIVDIVAMVGWGVGMALVGFPLSSLDGWRFAGLLALLCAVTEVVQVLRDAPSDRQAGLRTTAVALGTPATAWVGRLLIAAAGIYTFLLLDQALAAAFVLALLVRLDDNDPARSWDRLRVIFGLTWLALLASFRLGWGPGGWLAGG